LERRFIGEWGILEREKVFLESGFIREGIYWREECIGEGAYWKHGHIGEWKILEKERGF
jgi:hypothetical protein